MSGKVLPDRLQTFPARKTCRRTVWMLSGQLQVNGVIASAMTGSSSRAASVSAFYVHLEDDDFMVRQHFTDSSTIDVGLALCNDEIKCMSRYVRRLMHLLLTLKQMQKFRKFLAFESLHTSTWMLRSPHTTIGHLYALSCSRTVVSSLKNEAITASEAGL